VQRRLAGRGVLHHRSVKIADLIIAASAEAESHVCFAWLETARDGGEPVGR